MNRRACLVSALAMVFAASAHAEDPLDIVPAAKKVGSGRMVYFLMPIFDATLYAPYGHYSPDKPFALSLTYLRSLNGSDIAHSGVDEMRSQGVDDATLAAWGKQMVAIFPDVTAGACITGVRDANGAAAFYQSGKVLGRVDDPAFASHFFAIWLGDKTSQPALRKQLLGAAA